MGALPCLKRVLRVADGDAAFCEYNAADAHPTLAEAVLDGVGAGVGADLLVAVWPSELSFLLRPREYSHRGRSLDGKLTDLLVAGLRATPFSKFVYRRSGFSRCDGTSLHRRNRVHVRSAHRALDSSAWLISRADAAVAAVGDLAPGLR